MHDWESTTYLSRVNIVNTALSQVGAHYLWGATGGIPGICSPHVWYNENRVSMAANSFDPRHPRIHTACSDIHTRLYCSGRSALYGGQPASHAELFKPCVDRLPSSQSELDSLSHDHYLWPRPDERPSARITYGESCIGKRHFDCVNFVNWAMSTILTRRIQFEIFDTTPHNWYEQSCPVYPSPDYRIRNLGDGASEIWAGDLIFAREFGHIGIATGATLNPVFNMVHAQSTQFGVRSVPYTPNRNDVIRRFNFFVDREEQAIRNMVRNRISL
jgi:hypothetical protein